MGLNYLHELKTLRDEIIGVFGDTELVKIMKKEGSFDKTKKHWKSKYHILTFDEYINYLIIIKLKNCFFLNHWNFYIVI